MRTIIAGSRTIRDEKSVFEVIDRCVDSNKLEVTEVLCGLAKGVDIIGEKWGLSKEIPVKFFPARWKMYGKRAGYIRNAEMAENADALVAIWDGMSRGTEMMIKIATEKELKVFVCIYP